jgi:hypothetical protein
MSTEKSRLAKTLESQLTESDTSMFEVGEQRERNHRYYSLQPIGNEVRGKSHYISPDVLDSVENKKALFKETFLTGRQVVRFKATGNQPPHEADAKTAYAEMMLQKNNKERLFRDGWHDAFVAKRMVVLATWKDDTRSSTLTIEGANQQQVMQLIAQEQNVVRVKQSGLQQVQPGVYAGELELEVDASYVDIELLQPERYYRDPNADYPESALWNTYEEDIGKGDLINRGYDPEQVEGLSMDYRYRSEEEDSSRKAHDRSWTRRRQHKRTEEQETVTYYRTWTWLDLEEQDDSLTDDIEGDISGIRLWEIHWAQGEILRWADGTVAVREVFDCPFFDWTEYKISHAEHGLADADIVAHTQKTQSTLKRLVIDNQQMRNSSRYEAQIGALKNPRDLLDNKIGGVVWSRKIGSVAALATPELSPMTMGIIGMLQQDNDKRSGMSDLAKGMNTDAVRYQNAEGLIDKLSAGGSRRVTGGARDWAQTFLVPLCQFIVRLGMENDKSQRLLEVGGRMIPIAPSQWRDSELNMAVAKALTPEEGQRFAQMMLMLHSTMSQDPQMQMLYGVSQKHALFDDIFDAIGVDDTTRYMMRPDSPEFQQAMVSMQQNQQQQAQKQEELRQFQMGLMMSGDRRLWEEFNWKVTNEMDDNNREDRKLDHQMVIDEEELDIERNQKRAANIGGGHS